MDGKIAERLKILRKAKRFTQMELSKKSGISQQLISHYESGRNRIGVANLIKIARVLGCEPSDIDERADGLGDVPAERQNVRKIDNKILLGIVDSWDSFSGIEQAEMGALLAAFQKKHERAINKPKIAEPKTTPPKIK
ncbi:hypothetical protein AGMMS49959_07340 [Planctomycetales bacterium]|nr:hypothetical protein AGMMS49959_07340 [Planctomycetales bacterium]